jgi:hypothetical protein
MPERPITHWNYRVFQRNVPDGIGGVIEEWTIRETYYDGNDPHSWTEPTFPFGETKVALMEDVTAMAGAIASPVLYLSDDGNEIVEGPRRGSLRR